LTKEEEESSLKKYEPKSKLMLVLKGVDPYNNHLEDA
jgi:hypothetical protein